MDQPINQSAKQTADQERSKRIDELLWQAVPLEGEALAELLDRECAGDAELRREVESLLGGEVDTREILKHSPAAGWRQRDQAGALRSGEQISHYRIEALLGVGGMGEVYLAEDVRLRRKVALKLLPLRFTADPERVKRFEREARAASALNHQNIITIYDIGQAGGLHFIAAERVIGQTLRQKLAGGPMTPREAMAIASQIAAGLAAAHEAGVVHRDIKPENLMARHDDQVKILDFGLAKLIDYEPLRHDAPAQSGADQNETRAGSVMGTPRYMSPEQAMGREVDHRADLFSLGVVLYEMVAGRAPFTGDNRTELQAAIIGEEPPPLEQFAPSTPEQLRRIIRRALEKDRERRYQTAAELLGDLKTLEEGLKHPAPRLSRRAWVALITVSAGALAAAVYGARSGDEPQPGRQDAAVEPPVFDPLNFNGQVEEVDVSPDDKLLAFTRYNGKSLSLWVREIETSHETEIVSPGAGYNCHSPTFSRDGGEIFYCADDERMKITALYGVNRLGGAPRRLIEKVDSPVGFSPDGRQLAFSRIDHQQHTTALLIANADGGAIRQIAGRRDPVKISWGRPAWSPDGKRVAFAAGIAGKKPSDEIYQVEIGNGAERPLSAQKIRGIGDLVWLGDNSGMLVLAAHPGNKDYHVWHLAFAGDRLRRLSDIMQLNQSLSAPSDGSAIYTVNRKDIRSLAVMRGDFSGLPREIVPGDTAGQFGIAWTPDDKIIYAGGTRSSQQLWIVDPDDPDRRNNRRFSFGGGDDDAPSVSRDGRYVVYSSIRTPGSNSICRMERESGRVEELTSGKFDVVPSITPDGKWVFYISWKDGVGSIWKVPLAGGQATQLTDGHITNPTPTISPDGQLLAYCQNTHGDRGRRIEIARFDDLPLNGKPPSKILPIPDETNEMRWSPDGRGLVYYQDEGPVDNFYLQPLDGGPRKRLTNFTQGRTDWFAWSLDGRRLALSRLITNRDVIRISEFR